jgi:hypothetical protein
MKFGELSAHMREHFEFDPLGEYSIELDPRYADRNTSRAAPIRFQPAESGRAGFRPWTFSA